MLTILTEDAAPLKRRAGGPGWSQLSRPWDSPMFRFTIRDVLWLMLVVTLAVGVSPSTAACRAADDAQVSRTQMATRLSKVQVGQSVETVLSLAGPPDKRVKKDTD